jgi:phage-related baseplate assembly protein
MIVSLSDLLQIATREEVEDTVLQLCSDLGLNTTNWRAGGKVRSIIAAVSQKIADLTVIASQIAGSGFLDFATGTRLTVLSKEVFNVDRELAEAGLTDLTVTNASGSGIGPFAPGDFHALNTATGKTYSNLTTFSVPNGSSLDVSIQADEVGSASSAGPGQIDDLVTPVIGVSVTNAVALVGTDDEDDDALADRDRLAFDALSPDGAAKAYLFVARTTPGSDVTRVNLSDPTPQGAITVYLASASGPSATVALVNTAIQETVVPTGGPTATVVAATPVTIDVVSTVTILASANLTTGETQAAVLSALTAYFAEIPIGGYAGKVYTSDLSGIIRGAHPKIVKVVLTSPAADATLAAGEVAVLGATTTTVVIL